MTSSSPARRIYVYILRRPCGEPFYVGVGRGIRITLHEAYARRGDDSHKSRLIRKIWRSGGQVIREYESWHEDDASAKCREIELIAQIGRKDLGTGPLVNRTDGGEGVRGISAEMRQIISERTKAGMASEAVREACRSHMMRLGREWREKANEAVREYWKSPANRAAQSERTRSFKERNPEAFRAGVEARKRAQQTPEAKARMSAAAAARWTPEFRAKRAETMRRKREAKAWASR